MIKKISLALLCAIILISTAIQASAAIVHYEYFGKIVYFMNEVDLGGNFSLNDPMRVQFSYDTAAQDLISTGDYGEYAALSLSIEVTHGSNIFTYSGLSPIVRILNNHSVGSELVDHYSVLSGSVTGPAANSHNPSGVNFQLTDYQAEALTDDSLLASIPDLSMFEIDNWNMNYIVINFYDDNAANPNAQIRGQITGGGRTNPVPIPGAILLLGSGIAGLAAIRRRIKQF